MQRLSEYDESNKQTAAAKLHGPPAFESSKILQTLGTTIGDETPLFQQAKKVNWLYIGYPELYVRTGYVLLTFSDL